MERDNFEISQELEQMREQFKVLTDKVEKQKIVNERLLESSVKSKVDKYTGGKKGWISIIIIAYIVYIDIEYCIKYNLPLWCTIFVGVGFSAMVLISIFSKLKWQKDLDFKGDVSEFAVKVREAKKFHIITTVVSTFIGYAVLATFFYQFITIQSSHIREDSILVISAFLLIMFILGVIKTVHRFRILDDILKDIEE
ncbi:MAG: hypothetical protein J6B97_08705 [Bacteroidales bacterium]|nr:hypothetical protein [Bacteroidales bacterium]